MKNGDVSKSVKQLEAEWLIFWARVKSEFLRIYFNRGKNEKENPKPKADE
jgi:hypothetical protein